jgi:hypothetical protein
VWEAASARWDFVMLELVIVRVVSFCTRYSFAVVIIALVLGLCSAVYSVRHFAIDTDISGLLSPDLPWRKREADFRKAFPQQVESILAIIEAPTPEFARGAARDLDGRLSKQGSLFRSVSNPTGSDFFVRDHAFLDEQRQAFLTRILGCALQGDRRKVIRNGSDGLRTYLNSWYANHKGGGFVKSTGTVQWFNRGRFEAFQASQDDAGQRVHFIGRMGRLARQEGVDLVKDHAVPVCIMYDEMVSANLKSTGDIERYLLERYRFGILTGEEDRRLTSAKLRKRMPEGNTSVYARTIMPMC